MSRVTRIQGPAKELSSLESSFGAEEGTRTPTPLRVHGPEPCASANSATSAFCGARTQAPSGLPLLFYRRSPECQTSAGSEVSEVSDVSEVSEARKSESINLRNAPKPCSRHVRNLLHCTCSVTVVDFATAP